MTAGQELHQLTGSVLLHHRKSQTRPEPGPQLHNQENQPEHAPLLTPAEGLQRHCGGEKKEEEEEEQEELRGQEEERSSRGAGPIISLLQLLLLVPLKLSRPGVGGGGNPNFKWGLVSLPHPPIVAQITPPLLQPRGCPDIDLEPRLAARLASAPPPVQVHRLKSPLSFVPIGHAEKLHPSSSSCCGPPGPLWLIPSAATAGHVTPAFPVHVYSASRKIKRDVLMPS